MKEFPGSGIEGLEAFRAWWEKAHKEVKYLAFAHLGFPDWC